ncbi:MAG: hypothetical protein U5J63_17400 [Fodinibius sp.]|nr:hypothetical protein [Fodinibius sp.]
MLTGKNIYPRKAYKMGLVDELTHKDAVLYSGQRRLFTRSMKPASSSRKDKRCAGSIS